MERQEKTEFILEQMRLSLAKEDYIRTQIISKKINIRFFSETSPTVQQLKIRFYKQMIQLSEHDKNFLETCQHYRQIHGTECVNEDESWWKEILKFSCIYIILSPYFNEQEDLINRILLDKQLGQLPDYKDILTLFTTLELIYWSDFYNKYQILLRDGTDSCPAVNVFNHSERGEEMWIELHRRITEHNIRVMAKHYTRISINRMTHLLALPQDTTEEITSHLVVNKTIYARIDRSKGIVCFRKPLETHQYLSDWSHSIENLMGFVSKSVHLINKEEMIHKLK
ncbi:26S proteasome non-ATPase regulatory subunit 12 [Oopsacas minuta]|uniref:26S proteasome non-ATPase regulatory subunit 12 n=1 Tax=Oopsacas minuta TaxID=111878 RepID=A0AAV7JC94_9METZ|nr:26S proteasome non-ATPase regulatory subunit 12 [Oopsacas minuta]